MFSLNCEKYNPVRRYVQFNDIVIDSFDMLSSVDYSQNTKTDTEEYSFGHGSYVDFKSPQQFLTEGDLNITMNIDYRKYRREERKYLKDFIKMNLIKPGRLWAIEDNKILWAYAYVSEVSEPFSEFKGNLSYDITFKIYEGVWHITDPMKTYLVPYSTCDFMECYDFREIEPCQDCCISCKKITDDCQSCLCHCEDLEKENSLCVVGKKVVDDFMNCGESYLLVYDCNRAYEFFQEKTYGHKICKNDVCLTTIAGQFYSSTILDTSNVDIRLEGKFQSPIIEINGNKIQLMGDYEGIILIGKDGSLKYSKGACCPFEDIDLDNLVIIDDFEFQVHHGMNSVIVTNSCCEMACIYIYVDEITY